MKKLLKIITGVTLSLAMAIGVSVGVISNKNATKLDAAADGTYSLEITYTDFTTSSYANNNGSHSKNASKISGNGDSTMSVSYTSYQAYQNSSKIQFQKKAGYIYNTTNLGTINSVSFSNDKTSGLQYYIGTTENPSSSGTGGFFKVYADSTNSTQTCTTIIISYSISGGGDPDPEPTGFTVSFNANGGTGSMSNVSNVDGNYTLPSNSFTAPSGKVFIGWKAGNAGDLIEAGGEYNVTEDVVFWAQWEDRYTVKYNANGGTGTIADSNSPYAPSASVTVKSSTGFTAPFAEMIFDKWNTAADGSGQDYNPEDTFDISANTTLYAQWIDDPTIPYTNVYNTGFESSESFSNTTTYNSEKDDGPTGKQWHIYYGTASNGSPLVGGQSIQMRWYGSAPSNHPYIQTNFKSIEVKRVTFKYKVSNKDVDFKTQYNTDGGDSWTDIETVDTQYTSIQTYRKIFATPISSFYFRILVCEGTAPTGNSKPEFRVDSVTFDSIATPATINGDNNVQVGAQWSPTSITENVGGAVVTGATYAFVASNGAVVSSSNESTGAFTCSADGIVTVSATKSGYLISNKVVTVQPADPYINNFSDASPSGFTGDNDTITFSYGNLTNTLAVESNDPSVVTVSSLTYLAGSGSVVLNYVGAGSTTVSFKDGDDSLASISVTVEQSMVSISGMPANKTISNGSSLNIGTLITVTATGICSNNVSWSSSVTSVAEVNSSGVVTALKPGSTVVTASPNDYPAGAVSCTIAVVNDKAILASSISSGDIVILGAQAVSMQYSGPSNTSTVYGLGSSFTGSPNIDDLTLEVQDGSVTDSFAFRITSGVYEDKYLTWSSTDQNKLNNLDVSDSIDSNSSWNVAIDGDDNAAITNVATPARKLWWNVANTRFACYTDKSNGDSYKYVQLWKLDRPEDHLDFSTTLETLHAHENYTAEVLTSVDSVAIRFGATVSKTNWDAIKANWTISDYGVMLMKEADLDNSPYISLEEAFNDGASSSILKIINKRAGGAAYADPYLDGDNYLFTVKVSFPDNCTYYDDRIYAVPFVVISDQYYFFNETNITIRELAYNCIGTGYECLSDAALEFIFDAH